MPEVELLVIAVAAVATAALTAVAGAGGGVVLLIVILQFVDPVVAIPAHGVVQLVSNGTRTLTLTLRSDAETHMMRWYVPLLVPATIIGFFISDGIPKDAGRAIIGVFGLVAVWWPAATAWLAPRPGSNRRFALVGAFAGLINPTIGATGPLLAPAFRAATRSHVSFVATFSLAQVLNHTVKVAVFAAAGFAWSEHLPMIGVAAVGVIVGTRIGTRYLRRLDPDMLGRVFQLVVTAGAIRLLVGIL